MAKAKNNDTQINIRVPKELAKESRRAAQKMRRSLPDLIREFLRALAETKQQEKA
jgi:hypothetical protein